MKFKQFKLSFIAIAVIIITIGIPVITDLSSTAKAADTTTIGVKAAKWGSNVKLSYSGNDFTFASNGIPNHSRPAEYVLPNPGVMIPTKTTAYVGVDPTKAQTYSFTIPLNPTKAAKPTSTSLGSIGVMLSGATLFNPYEGDGKSVATKDNFTLKNSKGQEVAFLDSCNGHPTPMGQYHYHAVPSCITKVVDKTDGPSHLIGVAFDGFPIYGDRAMNGKVITSNQLDTCNGITSATPEFSKGIYHYVLLNAKDSTSSIKCFAGTSKITIKMPGMQGGGGMPGGPGGPSMGRPPGRPGMPPPPR
jgi:YHYH protein